MKLPALMKRSGSPKTLTVGSDNRKTIFKKYLEHFQKVRVDHVTTCHVKTCDRSSDLNLNLKSVHINTL